MLKNKLKYDKNMLFCQTANYAITKENIKYQRVTKKQYSNYCSQNSTGLYYTHTD